MVQLIVFMLICFVNGACRANPIMYFKISKNEVIPLKNKLMITSKEVTVEILVQEILPAQSHDVVTLDELTCYNNNSSQIIFSNINFAYVKKKITNYTQYITYRSTQEIKILTRSYSPWQCKLYVHWNGSNVGYKFEVKVEQLETNKSTSNDNDEKMSLPEHNVPAKTKQLTKGEPKNIKHVDKATKDLNEDVGAEKKYLESTENIITNKNLEKGKEKQTTKPKSLSSENTAKTPRYQKDKNQKPIEKNDRTNLDIGVKPSSTFKNVNDSSQVAYGEISKSTTCVIFVVASVVIFLVGLVVGAICRRPASVVGTTAPMPDPPELTDDQMAEHIYEEVVDTGIRNHPPLPIPEKAVYIYNSPYDHTRWFQNQSALN